jgi:hypothetical protein
MSPAIPFRASVKFGSHIAAQAFFRARFLANADLIVSRVEVYAIKPNTEIKFDELVAELGGKVV